MYKVHFFKSRRHLYKGSIMRGRGWKLRFPGDSLLSQSHNTPFHPKISQEKLQTVIMQTFLGGKKKCIMGFVQVGNGVGGHNRAFTIFTVTNAFIPQTLTGSSVH